MYAFTIQFMFIFLLYYLKTTQLVVEMEQKWDFCNTFLTKTLSLTENKLLNLMLFCIKEYLSYNWCYLNKRQIWKLC